MALSKDEILDAIAEMSVMDIVELVEAMEEKFGVSAAAAVAVAAPAAGGDAGGAAAAEQTEFDVILTSCLLYTSPSPRDMRRSRMPSSA